MITLLDFKKNLRLRIKSFINFVIISLFLALGLSFLQPFLYKSSFSILIVQDAKEATDVYTAIKSADKLGNLLQRIVKTAEFYDSVMTSDFKVSKDDFSSIERNKRRQWDQMISVSPVQEAGILEFDVYYKTREGAEEYANAIADTLINKSSKFYGASGVVKIRVINAPLTSDNIAKPKIFLNIMFGLFLGLFCGLFYVYFTIPIDDKERLKSQVLNFDISVDEFLSRSGYNNEKIEETNIIEGDNKNEIMQDINIDK